VEPARGLRLRSLRGCDTRTPPFPAFGENGWNCVPDPVFIRATGQSCTQVDKPPGKTRVLLSSAMQMVSATEAVVAPSARQRIALSVILYSLRGVETSLIRYSNIGLRATGRRGRCFARLQLQISSWQGLKRRNSIKTGTKEDLGVY
jgi:hypothetical protein